MRAAVLGRPVAHSLSPVLHRAAYAALGLSDWTYDALDIGAEDLPVLLAGLGEEWRGFSVTMPCKQAAVDAADVVEPLPRLLHAANTLVRTADGDWRFFVVVDPDTGETRFAATGAEHQQNVLLFQQWLRENPGN